MKGRCLSAHGLHLASVSEGRTSVSPKMKRMGGGNYICNSLVSMYLAVMNFILRNSICSYGNIALNYKIPNLSEYLSRASQHCLSFSILFIYFGKVRFVLTEGRY